MKFLKDEFLRNNLIVFQAAVIINLCSLIYHLFMVRSLTVAEYGILNALAVLYLVLTQPAEIFDTVITKFASSYSVSDKGNDFRYFIFHISRKIAILSTVILFLLLVFSQKIGDFLKIDSQALIVLLAVIVFISFFSFIISGVLKGYQKFTLFSFYLLLIALLKLGFGILLVMLGFGVLGVMSGWVIAQALSLALGIFLLVKLLFGRYFVSFKQVKATLGGPLNYTGARRFGEIYKYTVFVACHSILVVSVTNMDLFLVKHFFHPETTGFYSIAQIVGKITLFAPTVISTVLFSKASQVYAEGSLGIDVFKKSLLYVAVVCAVMVLVCMLFPSEIIRLISGRSYPQSVPLTGLFAISMSFFALCIVIFNYNLSMQRFKYLFFLLFFLLTEAVVITLFHASLIQVLVNLTIISILLFISSLLFTVLSIAKETKSRKY